MEEISLMEVSIFYELTQVRIHGLDSTEQDIDCLINLLINENSRIQNPELLLFLKTINAFRLTLSF